MLKPKKKGGLGFQDLEKFNMALLAKQLCRLHSNPYTFLAQTLKERYTPRSLGWSIPIGFNPSYA